jgi:hypothetical protein
MDNNLAPDAIEILLHKIGERALARLEGSRFNLQDQADISILIRSSMEDVKSELTEEK